MWSQKSQNTLTKITKLCVLSKYILKFIMAHISTTNSRYFTSVAYYNALWLKKSWYSVPSHFIVEMFCDACALVLSWRDNNVRRAYSTPFSFTAQQSPSSIFRYFSLRRIMTKCMCCLQILICELLLLSILETCQYIFLWSHEIEKMWKYV